MTDPGGDVYDGFGWCPMSKNGPFASESLLHKALQNIRDGVYIVDRGRKILFWNSGAERITGYSAKEITGSLCFENILRHVDDSGQLLCHAGCPLAGTMDDGESREADVYLHHRSGHRVPIHVKTAPIRDAGGVVIGAVETFSENRAQREIMERFAELEKMAMRDPLTGLANRRYMENRIEMRLSEKVRFGWPVGLAILDVDDFKKVNDTFGHDVGDKVLKMVSATLVSNLRSFDDLGRWGGEEFLMLAANIEGNPLFSLVDRLRILVSASCLDLERAPLCVTVSAGVSGAKGGDSWGEILKRADEALYISKRNGKNRSTVL